MTEILKKEVLKIISKDELLPNEAIITEKDWQIHDFQQFKDAPRRIEAERNFSNEKGFCAYVKDFKGENTAVFIQRDKVVASLDYHANGKPSWNKHKAILNFQESVELKKWLNLEDKLIDSKTLVEFLELNFAVMNDSEEGYTVQQQLEIFRDLRAKTEVENNSKTASYDNSLEYKNRAFIVSGANGKTELPKSFLIGGNFFNGIESPIAFEIKIFARLSKEDNKILFRLNFVNKERQIEYCLESIQNRYIQEFEGCKIYLA